jgi:predicted short-subunit dehydrogenase-like oxidoreductase (DUF2520 family)
MKASEQPAHLPTIAIIGPGKVGTSLAILASKAGYAVAAIGGRNYSKCVEAAQRVNQASRVHGNKTKAASITEAAGSAELVFLTVNDDAIGELCQNLAKNKHFKPGTIVAHVSGTLSSDVLSAAKNTCSVASAHPLQTFATVESAEKTMPGTYWFLEGDLKAVSVIKALVFAIGGKPNETTFNQKQKALYHAATVTASNYLVALIDTALSIMAEASISRDIALLALAPLITTTVHNTVQLGPSEALTGPIARGDIETVKNHLQVLVGASEDLAEIYRTMGRKTVQLALDRGSIDKQQAGALFSILSNPE